MATHLKHAMLMLSGAALVVISCASEETVPVSATPTTNATVATPAATRVARKRCQRAAECNRIGSGQMYADKSSCMEIELRAAADIVGSCPAGVDAALLDHCIDALENQHCDADMGPVAAMRDCNTYCRR